MKKDALDLAGALRRLFKNRFILRSRGVDWFQIIIDNQQAIAQVLEKMGAALELNEALGLAYIKSLSEETEEQINYQLGSTKNLGRYPSILLIFLRQKRLAFFSQPGNEERPLVKTEEMREHLNEFNFHKEDRIFQRDFIKAVNELTELQILLRTAQDNIFEISSVCDVVLPVDQVQDLLLRLQEYMKSQDREIKQDNQNNEEPADYA